ncbi:hypothetical protein [Hyphococcus sp.]|uniref:hypothetical protein n=1 Tax=Hyphococcus sp. TaxID=2038636 RepID=UPI0035C6A80C
MRFTATCLSLFAIIAACERKTEAPAPAEPDITQAAEAPASDVLPGLPGAATGIAFWDHPTLSFNSTMIVATEDGIVAYNMEDGNEVARLDGFNTDGVASGYFGLGARAAGFIVFLDADENAFRFRGIDNESRAFLPLDGGPQLRGAVRDFCTGRSLGADASSLFVIQRGKIQVFNLAASDAGVVLESEATIDTPDNIITCAVDIDGRLLAASDNGDIYRVAGDDAFTAPMAQAAIKQSGALAVISAQVPSEDEDEAPSLTGQILFADLSNGALHVFESVTGKALGAVKITATDELAGVDSAEAFGATGGNLGGLYRNGAVVFGVAGGESGPAAAIAPTSSVRNALSIEVGEPVSERGEARVVEDGDLVIEPSFTPQ